MKIGPLQFTKVLANPHPKPLPHKEGGASVRGLSPSLPVGEGAGDGGLHSPVSSFTSLPSLLSASSAGESAVWNVPSLRSGERI